MPANFLFISYSIFSLSFELNVLVIFENSWFFASVVCVLKSLAQQSINSFVSCSSKLFSPSSDFKRFISLNN